MKKNKTGVVSKIDSIVSHNIKIKRLLLGFSQEKLGKALGVSIQQIQKYEKGRNRISSGHLYNLAKLFKVPTDYFFEDDRICLLRSKNPVKETQIINLVKAFNHINNMQVQNKLIEIVKHMSEV